MKALIVIPARYSSSRLPGKPLRLIGDKPMVQLVYEQAKRSQFADDVVIATDDQRIYDAVEQFGGNAIMTSNKHKSGTERIVEVSEKMKADLYINVQGDEPFVKPEDIDLLIHSFSKGPDIKISTLCYEGTYLEAIQDTNAKVVLNNSNKALYFSRSLIPFTYQPDELKYFIHVGMYGYRDKTLQELKHVDQTFLEKSEKLEQLKFLETGYQIHVEKTGRTGPSVDTEACLEKARRYNDEKKCTNSASTLSEIKMVIMDVDGVLSPPSLLFSSSGEELKEFYVRDGLGIKNLIKAGIKLAVISGRGSKPLEHRLKNLGIYNYHFNITEKGKKVVEIRKQNELEKAQVLYVGDDLNDLPAFLESGISCTVNDAPIYMKSKADLVLKANGGRGAIRELSDMIIGLA